MQRNIGPKLGQYNTNDFLFLFRPECPSESRYQLRQRSSRNTGGGGEEGRGGESKKRCKPMLS